MSDVMQDKGHNATNLPMIEIMSHGSHVNKKHTNEKN